MQGENVCNFISLCILCN